MLVEVHMIQNHSPANLNRDDLGAPKTCWFGGVLRARISSQCLKRSIRMSRYFEDLRRGVRTRRLAKLLADDDENLEKKAEAALEKCGILPKKKGEESKMLIYTTEQAIKRMKEVLMSPRSSDETPDETSDEIAKDFARIIANETVAPDMALTGRMLEPGEPKVWKGLDTTVEAALQAAHAVSTHEAKVEVDYYVAADDISGADAGAGYVDEAMFTSACFYKYFSIHWEQLLKNLAGDVGLAFETITRFICAAALVTPTGKQNSYAAFNPPDGILVEIKETNQPLSYANAFADPVLPRSDRGLIAESIARLGHYVHLIETGYGIGAERFWFSPGARYPLNWYDSSAPEPEREKPVIEGENGRIGSLDELLGKVEAALERTALSEDA